jgi:uncharacterized membrane protein
LFRKLSPLGPLFLALFLILGGIQHFVYLDFVTKLVPSWIPGPRLWVYFTGLALIAGGVGILVPKTSRLAATMTGIMILLWVLLLHIPRALADPHAAGEISGVFEALALSGVAFILDGCRNRKSRRTLAKALLRATLGPQFLAANRNADHAHDLAVGATFETHQAIVQIADQELVVADRQQQLPWLIVSLIEKDTTLQGHAPRPVGSHHRRELPRRHYHGVKPPLKDLMHQRRRRLDLRIDGLPGDGGERPGVRHGERLGRRHRHVRRDTGALPIGAGDRID